MNYRTRHIEPKLKNYSSFFKTVLVVGARHVGKSSLLAHQFAEMKGFVFDAVQDVHGVRRDPDLFLDRDLRGTGTSPSIRHRNRTAVDCPIGPHEQSFFDRAQQAWKNA